MESRKKLGSVIFFFASNILNFRVDAFMLLWENPLTMYFFQITPFKMEAKKRFLEFSSQLFCASKIDM